MRRPVSLVLTGLLLLAGCTTEQEESFEEPSRAQYANFVDHMEEFFGDPYMATVQDRTGWANAVTEMGMSACLAILNDVSRSEWVADYVNAAASSLNGSSVPDDQLEYIAQGTWHNALNDLCPELGQ